MLMMPCCPTSIDLSLDVDSMFFYIVGHTLLQYNRKVASISISVITSIIGNCIPVRLPNL